MHVYCWLFESCNWLMFTTVCYTAKNALLHLSRTTQILSKATQSLSKPTSLLKILSKRTHKFE